MRRATARGRSVGVRRNGDRDIPIPQRLVTRSVGRQDAKCVISRRQCRRVEHAISGHTVTQRAGDDLKESCRTIAVHRDPAAGRINEPRRV